MRFRELCLIAVAPVTCALFFGSACKSESNGIVGNHPQPHALPSFIEDGISIDTLSDVRSASNPYLSAFRSVIGARTHYAFIGSDSSAAEYMFGEIADVQQGSDSTFLVLDSRYATVREYTWSGQYVRSYGHPGNGPGEFVAPRNLEILGDSLWAVLEQRYALKVFNPYELDGHDLASWREATLSFGSFDLCSAGDDMFIQGLSALQGIDPATTGVVHPVSSALVFGSPFGPVYGLGNVLVQDAMSRGRLACSRYSDTVVLLYHRLPYIVGFNTDGEFKWASRIEHFSSYQVTEYFDQGHQAMRSINDDEYLVADYMQDFVMSESGVGVLQYLRFKSPTGSERDDVGVYTYLIDLTSGEGLFVGRSLPRILMISNRYLVTLSDSAAFPQIEVFIL